MEFKIEKDGIYKVISSFPNITIKHDSKQQQMEMHNADTINYSFVYLHTDDLIISDTNFHITIMSVCTPTNDSMLSAMMEQLENLNVSIDPEKVRQAMFLSHKLMHGLA